LRENATFSEKSLNNYLAELAADGLVKRIDPESLADREISEVGPDKRGYYLITETGLDAVTDDAPDHRPA
jgi:DNA-binding HxlR family transcriptional regulator